MARVVSQTVLVPAFFGTALEPDTMPPIRMNRRRFIGCSAAASLALGQGGLAEAVLVDGQATPVRLGVIGLGNRGTALLRSLLEIPGTPIVAVCDTEAKHRLRAQGIVDKGAAIGQKATIVRSESSTDRTSTRSSWPSLVMSMRRSTTTQSSPASTFMRKNRSH